MPICSSPRLPAEWSLQPTPQIVAAALDCLVAIMAVAMHGLGQARVEQALAVTPRLTYRQERPVVGAGENLVRQDISIC